MTHLLDELHLTLGPFDVTRPRDGARWPLCLQFLDRLLAPRIAEIADVIERAGAMGDLVLGLAFWADRSPRFLDPEGVFALLASHDIGRKDAWQRRTIASSADDERNCDLYSQSIERSKSRAMLLSEIITRMDHGTWQRVAATFYLWVRGVALFRFWDDRGADVLCRDEATLNEVRARFAREADLTLTRAAWPHRAGG